MSVLCAPDSLTRRYARYAWELMSHKPFSGATVYRLDATSTLYLKYAPIPDSSDSGVSPLAEAQRLEWLLANDVPCPEIVDYGTLDEHEYIVTAAAPGLPASHDWPPDARLSVVDAVADFATGLHRLPIAECPFDRRLKVTVPLAQEIAGLGEVDLAGLDKKRRGWTVTRLVTELLATARQVGREEPVVCHGDYCLPNVLVDPDTWAVTAIVDVGRLGVADRYADLALMTRSLSSATLNPQFGPQYSDRFMYRYGELPADSQRLELYRLLDEFF